MRLPIMDILTNLRPAPNRAVALDRYRMLAAGYDGTVSQAERMRRVAIEMLMLREGETVIDVACGSGLSFAGLAAGVGRIGTVIGIDQCPHMIERARARAGDGILPQVRVVNAPMESAAIGAAADALLFCFTHDVLQTPTALANLMASAKPRARVAITGLRVLPWWWATPVNLWNLWRTSPYLTTFAGLRAPWAPMLPYCPNLAIARTWWFGAYYLAVGVVGPERG